MFVSVLNEEITLVVKKKFSDIYNGSLSGLLNDCSSFGLLKTHPFAHFPSCTSGPLVKKSLILLGSLSILQGLLPLYRATTLSYFSALIKKCPTFGPKIAQMSYFVLLLRVCVLLFNDGYSLKSAFNVLLFR